MRLGLEHSYAQELPDFHVPAQPSCAPQPRLLFWNRELSRELNLPLTQVSDESLAEIFSGNALPEDAHPIAQAYAGHQFGHFSPQLGDGRAMLLGEVVDGNGHRFDLSLKGSGRTAFARGGDGKAAVGPMLREVLIGEALHALGIPTTRALAVVATGESIWREGPVPAAVLTRVASSHIRVGTFEYFSSRGHAEKVRQLSEHAIARHFPDLIGREDRHARFLRAVALGQADLVARWMNVGFVHGVMNTDNMAVSGESIDFGPCAFIEGYDPATVFSSIDHGGRYAYANQGPVARWNLARLAEALLPFLSPDPEAAVAVANGILEDFTNRFEQALQMERFSKLGLPDTADNAELLEDWLELLRIGQVDWTSAWRFLADAALGHPQRLQVLFEDQTGLGAWLLRWRRRCLAIDGTSGDASATARAAAMRRVNPARIPRNHLVEEALSTASERGDLGPFLHLLEAVRDPFSERPDLERFAEPAPPEVTARYRTFCGT